VAFHESTPDRHLPQRALSWADFFFVKEIPMKRALSILLVLLAAAASASAQDKPNFVGTWKLTDPAQPDQFTATQIVVSQDASVLTVVTSGQMGEFKTTYNLDGSMGRSPLDFQGMTIDRATKLTWNEKKLTLTTTSDMNGQTMEFKSVVSLGADGSMIIESTFPDFQGGGAPITAKAIYKKA
jgi:hypothetical protein